MNRNENSKETTKDPYFHAANIKRMLTEAANHAREDANRVDQPKAQALFETTAEVLLGLVTAYDHFVTGAEKSMR